MFPVLARLNTIAFLLQISAKTEREGLRWRLDDQLDSSNRTDIKRLYNFSYKKNPQDYLTSKIRERGASAPFGAQIKKIENPCHISFPTRDNMPTYPLKNWRWDGD